MKKKLEADLMSIAHRVLQMKNKSDVNQLCIESRKLYEKLTLLQFVEEHFQGAKPTIGQAEVISKIEQVFEENNVDEVMAAVSNLDEVTENVVDEEQEQQLIEENEIVEAEISVAEEVDFNVVELDQDVEDKTVLQDEFLLSDDSSFQPAFELDMEPEEQVSALNKAQSVQISFEDLLGADYSEALFVKVDKEKEPRTSDFDFELPKINQIQDEFAANLEIESVHSKAVSLNDKLAQGISIDLNDRIGFVKNLFSNSEEDYTRVVNQLITYDNFEEAKDFILDMVKPDYQDWIGKEAYEQRFMEIVEKKFSNG